MGGGLRSPWCGQSFTRSCKGSADLGAEAFDQGRFDDARTIFEAVATREPLADFLTLPAYELLP